MADSSSIEYDRHRYIYSKKLRKQVEAGYVKNWHFSPDIYYENAAIIAAGELDVAGIREVLPVVSAEVFDHLSFGREPGTTRYRTTHVCVAHADSLTAALIIGDACVLSFANGIIPGGRYRAGGLAQEEDMCRLLPQLYPSLVANSDSYPLSPDRVLISRDMYAIRQPGSYNLCAKLGSCTVLSAAMPCGLADRRPKGGWVGSVWEQRVTLTIRAVLAAARYTGHANLVLGAFGCGAFGNPARQVARIFREQLESEEFRGAFSCVVFAVIDPVGTGNLRPFREEMKLLAL